MRRVLLALAVLAAAAPAFAQQDGTRVQQSPTELRACTPVTAQSVVSTATTLTIPAPQAGQSIYIYEIDLQYCATSTAPAATVSPVNTTTTNLTNNPKWMHTWTAATSVCPVVMSMSYPTGLKSQTPGAAVTIVTPAGTLTNLFFNVNACYTQAP